MTERAAGNWLDTYMEYTEQSESPDTYHLFSGISVIAACIRRQAWLNMGYFKIFPNMYIVLVGPPGCRKNSAINIATGLISDMSNNTKEEKNDRKIHFSADSTTRESLIQALNAAEVTTDLGDGVNYRHSSLTIISKELSVFIGNSNFELLSLLTDLYDPHDKWEYRTKNKGTNTVVGVWLNLLGGTTPTWLVGSVPMNAIGGGFTSRIIFVVEDKPRKRTAIPIITEKELDLRQKLTKDLERISMLKGEFKLDPLAVKYFTEWYESIPHDELTMDLRFQGYYERKHIHLLKMSMIVSASFNDSMLITASHIKIALDLIERLEKKMVEAFGSAGRSTMANDVDDVLKLIQRSGPAGISRETLIRKLWRDISYDSLDKVIASLKEMGYIIDIRNGSKIMYYAKGENDD